MGNVRTRKACEWVINQTKNDLLIPNLDIKLYSFDFCVNGV